MPPVPADIEQHTAREVLATALGVLGGEHVAVATALCAEDIVILDLLRELNAKPRVFTIDTGRLPGATRALLAQASDYFGIAIEVYAPSESAVDGMVTERGINLFYRSVADRERCCEVRKIEPLARALAGATGWVTGLRRDHSSARAGTPKIAHDPAHGDIWKIAPLADWTEADVWRHVERHGLPHNRLYDLGYKSIGCDPCTRAVAAGGDPRSGRWWWEEDGNRECGMHVAPSQVSLS